MYRIGLLHFLYMEYRNWLTHHPPLNWQTRQTSFLVRHGKLLSPLRNEEGYPDVIIYVRRKIDLSNDYGPTSNTTRNFTSKGSSSFRIRSQGGVRVRMTR